MSGFQQFIEKAIENHESNSTPPENKRKSENQLSTEKGKPSKLTNLDDSSGYSSTTSMMSSLEYATGTRPKAIRIPVTQLNNIECVASFSLRQAIVKKDATHTHSVPPTPTLKDSIVTIGDKLLDKHFMLTKCLDSHFKDFLIKTLPKDDDTNSKIINPSSQDFTNYCNSIFGLTSQLITDLKLSKEDLGDFVDDANVEHTQTRFTP